MLCSQLWVEGDDPGALNVYESGYEAFDGNSEEIGVLVAAHASVAFADARHIGHLQEALSTRDLIDQAKGIRMERFKVSVQQAFVALTTAGSRSNIKLRDVAEHLTDTGSLAEKC